MGRTPRIAAALLAALALLPVPAGARKFQMSGSWVMRNGGAFALGGFVPLQFTATLSGSGGQMTHASMGNLTNAFGSPNGPIPGAGGVTATGSAPASLRVPQHRFVQDAMAAVPLSGINLAQVTTDFGIDGPYQAASLAPGGGPGSFTWCPTDPLCADGPGTMLASDPPHGMGSRNGRVIYRAGANQFGGVMQMGLRRGGVVSGLFAISPAVRVGHAFFHGNGGSTLRRLAPGGLGGPDAPATEKLYLPRFFVTQPLTFMAGSPIANPGPKLTTMLGLTDTGPGATLYFALGTTPMGFEFAQLTSHYGFAHTTGTAIAQQTWGNSGDDFFTFMGYDARTALGAGAIQTVAGGLSYVTQSVGTSPYATMHRVRMTLGAPIPSLSPAGAAAAGALLLVAAGHALRRRGTSASSE
jgi:hypothetical protein